MTTLDRTDDEEESRTILRAPITLRRSKPGDIAHYVVIAEGTDCGKKAEIGLTPITIGRRSDNRISLSDRQVSAHHCEIRFNHGRIEVVDLDSTNGTFIDGRRVIEPTVWPLGSVLQVGNQVFRQEYRRRDELRQAEELTDDLQRASLYLQSLLPRPLLTGPVRASWHLLPSAALGGDIFDYGWLDPEHFVLYLLDVCGHGSGAALHSIGVSSLLRQRSLPRVDFTQPAAVLDALNGAFPMERFGEMYFTCWYGVYTPHSRCLRYACGGHPPALLFGPERTLTEQLDATDPPIGILPELRFHQRDVPIAPGSQLVLYSDGAFEIPLRNGEMWSQAAFIDVLGVCLRTHEAEPADIFRAVMNQTGASRPDDDFSLIRFDFADAH